jgi:8-oxo-dGTP pyrophosphatase MutT (NUDIX family)
MSDQTPSAITDGGLTVAPVEAAFVPVATSPEPTPKKKRKKKNQKPLEERKVNEAGGVIVCDGKVVLRLTDKQRWIFPKGKLKKHESPVDAAIRESTEETGLKVEVIGEAADLLIHHEGKKRRFVFYLMRATAKTWDWPHHEGRDTYLISPERVASLIRHKGYAAVWAATEERVRVMCDEPTPFLTHESDPNSA